MFSSVKFRNFKSLKNFTVRLKPFNVLVGPNNAGKSTVLDAFRLLGAAVRYASRRNPTIINLVGETHFGYDIPTANLPISLANVHSDYNTDEETSISYALTNGNTLQLRFYSNSRCLLIADAKNAATRSTKQFKANFPISLFSFPTLGPLEEEEALLTDEYVLASQDTRRAHRMFRNIWYRRKKDFDAFRILVEQTWDGMSISEPELDLTYPPSLSMFCKEGRVDRELCWAGFGFQVWLQLLTHFLSASSADVLIVDEPEIYLHPDLQHRLFHLLKSTGKQVILATHSVEIVNEAEHDDIVLVNRVKKAARRIGDIEGLQEALFSIGSGQNVHLARLSKGRKLLFLEGDDYRLLRRFAARLKLLDLAEDINITVVPIGGFSQRHRIEDAAWTFEKVLKAEISIAAILDRDYRCGEEIDAIVQSVRATVPNFFVLAAKEIENYLLEPNAIAKAIREHLHGREFDASDVDAMTPQRARDLLAEISEAIKSEVLSQHISNRMRYFSTRSAKDPSTIAAEAIASLDNDWATAKTKFMTIPGKRVLTSLNQQLQHRFGISITPTQILRNMEVTEIPADLRNILENLNRFAKQ